MLRSNCDLKTRVQYLGYPLPLQIGGLKNYFCGRLRNLTANLTASIFGTKYDIDHRSSALTTTWVSYIVPKFHGLWSTNGFKLDRHFYPPYVNSAFYTSLPGFADGDQQTELNQTLPNGGW